MDGKRSKCDCGNRKQDTPEEEGSFHNRYGFAYNLPQCVPIESRSGEQKINKNALGETAPVPSIQPPYGRIPRGEESPDPASKEAGRPRPDRHTVRASDLLKSSVQTAVEGNPRETGNGFPEGGHSCPPSSVRQECRTSEEMSAHDNSSEVRMSAVTPPLIGDEGVPTRVTLASCARGEFAVANLLAPMFDQPVVCARLATIVAWSHLLPIRFCFSAFLRRSHAHPAG